LPTIGLQSILAAHSFNVPVVFRAIDVSHQLVPSKLLVWPTKMLENFIFNSVDLNIALTPHLERYVLNYGVSRSRIRRIPSGVDANMFSPGPRNQSLLSKWGIEADDPVILFMGTLYPFSGLDHVISDFRQVLTRHPRAKLLIVGAGQDEPRLKQTAHSAGVAKSVVFAGMHPYVALPDIVRSSDICINPFHLNGITENILPTKLFQYMSCGKPVLATSLPGTRAFISGEQEGVVYAELESFNNRIVELLNDPQRRELLGKKGYDAAIAYDWWNIARTMLAWLEQIKR
jgi:glycosyltransferase involved in cell wall biosynthesis